MVAAFPYIARVRFAVVVHNGQSRTPVPTNKMFVSPIEVGLAVGVCNGGSKPPPYDKNRTFTSITETNKSR